MLLTCLLGMWEPRGASEMSILSSTPDHVELPELDWHLSQGRARCHGILHPGTLASVHNSKSRRGLEGALDPHQIWRMPVCGWVGWELLSLPSESISRME